MTEAIQGHPNGQVFGARPAAARQPVQGTQSFSQTLAEIPEVRFSNHAQKRLQAREITLTDEGLSRLASAVDKAEQHWGRDLLVLMDNLAFIVNVNERLVVTALDTNQRGEGVFTKIDTVVLADPAQPAK